jgi:hypothetical protein
MLKKYNIFIGKLDQLHYLSSQKNSQTQAN